MTDETKNLQEQPKAEGAQTEEPQGKKRKATVTVLIPEVPGEKSAPVQVFVNGKKTEIPRNKQVKVPAGVAEVLEHSDIKFIQG